MLSLALSLALSLPVQYAAAAPPAIPVTAEMWHYAAPSGEQKELGFADIVAAIRANGDATQFVWQTGWPAWKDWKEVPALKAAVDAANVAAAAAAAPPPGAADVMLSYSVGGAVEQISASEVARRVMANPSGTHLAWKPGMAAWLPASEVTEVKAAMDAASMASAAPPPPPPAVGSEPTGKKPKGHKTEPVATEASSPGEAPGMAGMEGMKDGAEGGACVMCDVHVKVGGELRTAFTFANLGGSITENPDTGSKIEVNRARFVTTAELGKWATAKASINLSQTDDRSATDAGLTGVADGWAIGMNEAWVEVHNEAGGNVQLAAKVGAQEVLFGVNDYFSGYDHYYVDGRDAGLSLQQRFGVLPQSDFALGLHAGVGEKLAVDLQYLNGTGIGQVEDNYGKNMLGRAAIRPIDMLSVWVSGFYETKELDNSVTAYGVSGAAELRVKDIVGVLGEFHFGGEGTKTGVGYNSMGYQAAGAAYIRPQSTLISRISPVITYQAYNPQLGGDAVLNDSAISFAGNVYWNTGCDCRTVMTGLAFQSYIPENLAKPIENSLLIQTAAKF